MRKCKCGNQVANNARACPKCGHRFTSGLVKFLAFGTISVILFMVVIAAVSSNDSPTINSAPSVLSAPSQPPPVVATPPKPKTPAEMVAARKEYASVIDEQLLNMGIESKTYALGSQAKTLVIEDVLAGRVRQNAIQNNSVLFDNLRTLGFTRLEYKNNFDDNLRYGVAWNIK
jgi:hypothetical protein